MAEMIAMLNGIGAVPNGSIVPVAPNIDWDWRLKAGPGMVARRQERIATAFGEAPESDLDTPVTKAALWSFLAILSVGILLFAGGQHAEQQKAQAGTSGLGGRHHRRRTSRSRKGRK